MIVLILMINLLFRQQANAEWVISSDIKANANSKNQVKALIEKYRIDLEDAEKIVNLQYHERKYTWRGASSCQKEDPRLTYKTEDFEITSVEKNGSVSKSASISANLANSDPCYVPPQDGKWILVHRNLQEYRSEREIEDYLQKNKHNFPNTDPEEIAFASEDFQTYQWQGNTLCKPNDPRLFFQIDEGEVRYKDSLTSQPQHAFSFDPTSTVDPCGH
jgi:hypothetical protein